jgi:hypothetical protein
VERVKDVLTEARAAGLQVLATDERLVVRGPRVQEALARQLLEAKPAVLALLAAEEAEVAWRIAAMRPQVPRCGPIPFLVAREVEVDPGRCLSCGDALRSDQRVRCGYCVRAAQAVLGWMREGFGETA